MKAKIRARLLSCKYLLPSFRVDDGRLLLGIEGVDYDLAGVVGAWRTSHKILCSAILQGGDRITWKETLMVGADTAGKHIRSNFYSVLNLLCLG